MLVSAIKCFSGIKFRNVIYLKLIKNLQVILDTRLLKHESKERKSQTNYLLILGSCPIRRLM